MTEPNPAQAVLARMKALMRTLVDSGDATPQAQRMVLRVLTEELARLEGEIPATETEKE